MRPFELNIARKRGDTKRLSVLVKSSGKPVDISGWSNFQLSIDSLAEPIDNSTHVATLAGAITSGGLDGRVHFIVPATIAAGSYYYGARAQDANGEVCTFAEGGWRVTLDR